MGKVDKSNYGLCWHILGASENLVTIIKGGGLYTDEELFEIYSRTTHDNIDEDDWYAYFLATRDFHTRLIGNPGEPHRYMYASNEKMD